MPRRPENPSYQDIAKKAKVSIMTVSLALRNSPRVSQQTRTRIRRIADRLGYRADPQIAAMMGYLRTRRTTKDQPVLALINAREAPVAKLRRSYAASIA